MLLYKSKAAASQANVFLSKRVVCSTAERSDCLQFLVFTAIVLEFISCLKMNRGLQILLQKNAKMLRPLMKPVVTTPVRNSGT